MNKLLVGIGFVILVLGLFIAAYSLLSMPPPKIATEFYLGTGVGVVGFIIMLIGGFQKE